MMRLWWECPVCGSDVNFLDELEYVFDDDGTPQFSVDKDGGLMFLNIYCKKCDSFWTLTLSGMITSSDERHKQTVFELNDLNVHPNVKKQLEELMDRKDKI